MSKSRRQSAPRDRKRPFAIRIPKPPCTPEPPKAPPPPRPAGSGCDTGTGRKRYEEIIRGKP